MTLKERTKGDFDVSKELLAITQALITLSTLTIEKKLTRKLTINQVRERPPLSKILWCTNPQEIMR